MRKIDFDRDFKANDLKNLVETIESDGIIDVPARCMYYNDKVDSYHKNGLISDKQANEWIIPDALKKSKLWFS
jgi:hypothetical protein